MKHTEQDAINQLERKGVRFDNDKRKVDAERARQDGKLGIKSLGRLDFLIGYCGWKLA